MNLLRRHPIALTLLALLLWSGLQPLPGLVDAVTGTVPAGADLVRPTAYTVLAPLSNVLDALTFLSVQRAKAFLAVWVVALALWGGLRRGTLGRRLARALLGPLAIVLLGVGAVLLPRPVPSLVTADSGVTVIDYHAHTAASHDGRPGWRAQDLAAWHAAQGFQASYVTDHNVIFNQPVDEPIRLLPGVEWSVYAQHVLLVVGASDNHGWGKVTCVWNLSSPSAHGYAANHVIARPIALAQGDWDAWTAAYTQPWLMLRALSWGERSSWITWILVILIYRAVPRRAGDSAGIGILARSLELFKVRRPQG